MKKLLFLILILSSGIVFCQEKDDADVIKSIYDEALSSWEAYENLEWLCKNTKGRICGTPEAAAAVEFTYQIMVNMGLDSVWKQEIMVKNWKRGEPEQGRIISAVYGTDNLDVCALGLSPGTGSEGIIGEVIEVRDFEELSRRKDEAKGRIVFFNRPMDPTQIHTFGAYGGAANQRTKGPALAAGYGAIGCVVRSLNPELDDYPHTGVTQFDQGEQMVPAFAISTNGSDCLSERLKKDSSLKIYLRSTCRTYPDVPSHNVIGEIKGSEFPNKIITVGGHLDAWDNSEGAHDDGGGCMQAIEVLRLFMETGLRPKHTIRAVMFMDEEIAQRGGQAYAKEAFEKGEFHIAAMESDRGVLSPRAVSVNTTPEKFERAKEWAPLFVPYDLKFIRGGGGVDISPLKNYYPDIVFLGMMPDNQRYFRFHHSAFDTFEQVDRREMQMGAASMAAMVYLFDKSVSR